MGLISGQVPAVSSVVRRTDYRCGRSGFRCPGRSNRHSVANGSSLLRRFCVPQALSRGDGPLWPTFGGRVGSQDPLGLTTAKNETFRAVKIPQKSN